MSTRFTGVDRLSSTTYPLRKTASLLLAFFVAMSMYPEVQKAAQAELDAVVGTARLPTFSDREGLPYVNALFMECLRWHPIVPTGIPHVNTVDDEFEGYRVPRNTTIVPNIW